MVPLEYKINHLTTDMRVKEFRINLAGTWRTVGFLAKVEREYTPRDLEKLKDRLQRAVDYLSQRKPIDVQVVFTQVLNAVHESQKDGMGKVAININESVRNE